MTKNKSQEILLKELKELETKKEQEKKKLETLLQSKQINKKTKQAKNIGKIALIGTLTAATIFGINEARKSRQKDQVQREDDTKNTDKKQKADSTATFPTKIIITEDIIKKHITQDKLELSLSYKEIANTINNIQNNKIREEVITYLKQGKIREIQEMYGMKRNSKYISNKATDMIDKNTLHRLDNNLFGLYGKYLLKHKDIPQEVKDIYQKFLLGEIDNNNAAYMIVCKSNFMLYLFTKDHKLLYNQSTLLGKDIEKDQERIPYNYYNTNKGIIYHKKAVNTDTPEWLFKIQKTCKLDNNYICDGPKIGLVSLPINITTQQIEERYEYIKYEKRFHPIRKPLHNPELYNNALNSTDIDDNNISHGCPNIQNIGILIDNLTIEKSVEYTTHK